MIKKDKDLVSVCIPVYNGELFLEQTLQSIVEQTYSNIEILVGDNASDDNTSEIIKSFVSKDNRIKHLRIEKNVSFAANCNRLINQASGEFIAVYHADDIYDKLMVEKQLCYLKHKKHLAGAFTSANTINSKGDLLKKKLFTLDLLKNKRDVEVDKKIYLDCIFNGSMPFICPTSMIRKGVYKEVGGYNESLKYIEDVDLWWRILEKYSLGVLSEKLINYRFHDQQGSVIYRSNKRDAHGPLIQYLQNKIQFDAFSKIYNKKFCKMIAFDYIKLAVYAAELSDFSRFKKMMILSKEHYRFIKDVRLFVCQNMNKRLNYYFIKLVRKLSNRIRGY